MRANRLQSLSWFVALTMLVQAMAFGWMRPAVAGETDAPQIEGWVICTAHSEMPVPQEPIRDGKSADRHDLTCTMCAAGCVAPTVLASIDIDLPLPSEAGQTERGAAVTIAQPRAPPFSLPNARAPPSLS